MNPLQTFTQWFTDETYGKERKASALVGVVCQLIGFALGFFIFDFPAWSLILFVVTGFLGGVMVSWARDYDRKSKGR